MKLIEKIKNKLRKKLASFLLPELNKKEERNIYKFKKFGPDSHLWGVSHFITGAENIEIGKNVHINSNCYIRGEGGIEIGDNTHISRNLTLYSINHDYNGNSLPYDNKMIKKKVVIGKNVWIGMNVSIVPGTTIGDGCIIGLGTTVSGNIPPLSIVGSAKCAIIGNRNKEHYDYLESEGLYGAANGNLYKRSSSADLKNEGDVYFSARSKSTVINFNGWTAVKKQYYNSPDGADSYKKEKAAIQIFQKYNWFCNVLNVNDEDMSITTEYLPASMRLDNISNPGKSIAEEILWCLLDIFIEGYVHRDFHARNIFITEGGIKIIDFETFIPTEEKDFFKSYDVTGKGHESPYQTDNMCLLNQTQFSIGKIFGLNNINDIKELLNNRFKKQMLDSSISFKTLRNSDGRHNLITKNIYSSFELKNINISPNESQRNTLKRLEKFEIIESDIKGKTILDIGSNIGATLLGLAKYNPEKMLGLEYDADKVVLSNKLAKYNEINNIAFIQCDIENADDVTQKFDVVFCLAVIEHLKQKNKLFEVLSRVCISKLYFEGNAGSDIDYIKEELKKAGFTKIKYIGLSDDEKNTANNNRPLFIAER